MLPAVRTTIQQSLVARIPAPSPLRNIFRAYSWRHSPRVELAIRNLYDTLNSAGIWQKMDLFYMPACSRRIEDMGINWTNPGTFDMFGGVDPTYLALRGITGNGTTMYKQTGFIPATHAVNYTLQGAHVGVYAYNTSAVNAIDIGAEHDGLNIRAASTNNMSARFGVSTGVSTSVG